MLSLSLQNKVALVTGGSQGIGARVVRQLHAAEATVAINHPGSEITAKDAEQLADELNQTRPGSAFVRVADVSKPAEVQAMMQQIQSAHGGLDVLINNAAILRDRTIRKMTLEDWDAVLAVNMSGVFYCMKYGLEIMREEGAVVSFGSIAAREGFFGQANYASAKAGVESLTRVAAREAGRRRIRVNAVAPGVIQTAMAEQIPEAVRAEMLTHIPLGRFGTADEVASAIVFLCSPLASYITGHTLEINGGWRS